MEIKVLRLNESAVIPAPATDGAACFDLTCAADTPLPMGIIVKVRTGLAVEIPKGHFMEIVPRSGIASKGVIIPNSPAVIDSDYRGEVCVLMLSFSEGVEFKAGDRIAQARLHSVLPVEFTEALELTQTARGAGGFGSTGLNKKS